MKIFVLRLFKITGKQIEWSLLEQRSVIKYLVAEMCKPCEIYRKMCVMYREACFSKKKNLYKWVKHGFVTADLPEWKNTDFPVKKKFLEQRSVKVMLTVFWDMKGSITIIS